MHEYSILQALLGQIEPLVAKHASAVVRRIELKIGELSGVDARLLRVAFDTWTGPDWVQGATLVIREEPARWLCPGCDREIVAGAALRCPRCEQPARLQLGQDIVLERVQLELPDDAEASDV